MPKSQWTLQGKYKPWYVGWKICDKKASNVMQQFYESPSFLPKSWKLINTQEWIFMGTPGVGARFHIDFVDRPSFQAQVNTAFFEFKILQLRHPHFHRIATLRQYQILLKPILWVKKLPNLLIMEKCIIKMISIKTYYLL